MVLKINAECLLFHNLFYIKKNGHLPALRLDDITLGAFVFYKI